MVKYLLQIFCVFLVRQMRSTDNTWSAAKRNKTNLFSRQSLYNMALSQKEKKRIKIDFGSKFV